VVADGVSGRLVDGHDPETWADAIAAMLADDAAREILGRGAREHAQQFGWDVAAEAVLRVYDAAREHRAAR
jgi:D-inositol-3-phosphate glycosyltransferase